MGRRLRLRGCWAVLAVSFLCVVALASVVVKAVSLDVYESTPGRTLPRPNPVYTAAEREVLQDHFRRFLHLKAAEPFVHDLPDSNILFQILSPAPRHLGRYCGRGVGDDAAVEAHIEVVDVFGKKTRRALGGDGDGVSIVEPDRDRRVFPGEEEVLRRIPENEVWRVYYPSSTMSHEDSAVMAALPSEVWTEVITVTKVWANRVPREACRRALATELGYDPYERDALLREERMRRGLPHLGMGLQSYTYPLPGDEEGEGGES